MVEPFSEEYGMLLKHKSIPEDMSPKITDYELWVNDTMVGPRTKVSDQLIHLALSLDNADKTVVKLYNGRNLVDNCQIDATVARDKLEITTGYHVVRNESAKSVATYTATQDMTLKTVEFSFGRDF